MGVRENWVVPPGLTPDTASQSGAEAPGYFRSSLRALGLSSPFPSAEQLAEKVVEGARSTPQAQTHFQRLIGTTETRALPKPALIGVFPQVVKRCADTKPDFFRACEAVPFSPLAWPRVLRSEQALLEVRPLPREPPAICALQAVRGASLVRLRGLIRQRV